MLDGFNVNSFFCAGRKGFLLKDSSAKNKQESDECAVTTALILTCAKLWEIR